MKPLLRRDQSSGLMGKMATSPDDVKSRRDAVARILARSLSRGA